MTVEELIMKMKKIQCIILEFLEDMSSPDEKLEHFIDIITDYKITENKYELKSLLRLINSISSNFQRGHNFFTKIEQILGHFKNHIQKYFTNSEIFELFINNKRILLFLLQEGIMIFDEYVVARMMNSDYIKKKYIEYFAPEIKPFLTDEFIAKYNKKNSNLQNDNFFNQITKEVPNDFYNKRKIGENDDFLCQMIRQNKVEEFVTYVNRTNLSLQGCIIESIFETNQFLMDKRNIKLIEYAAFFGSNDIIKYMQINGVELPSSMWEYAIHSRNAELIKYLEDNHVSPPGDSFKTVLRESIKCHHNDVSNYIIDNLLNEEDLQYDIENKFNENLYRYGFEYYNYYFFPNDMKYKNMFFYLCEFDYYALVKLYLQNIEIDINSTNIKKSIF